MEDDRNIENDGNRESYKTLHNYEKEKRLMQLFPRLHYFHRNGFLQLLYLISLQLISVSFQEAEQGLVETGI
jgi:hypothetical protein